MRNNVIYTNIFGLSLCQKQLLSIVNFLHPNFVLHTTPNPVKFKKKTLLFSSLVRTTTSKILYQNNYLLHICVNNVVLGFKLTENSSRTHISTAKEVGEMIGVLCRSIKHLTCVIYTRVRSDAVLLPYLGWKYPTLIFQPHEVQMRLRDL